MRTTVEEATTETWLWDSNIRFIINACLNARNTEIRIWHVNGTQMSTVATATIDMSRESWLEIPETIRLTKVSVLVALWW